ncbi:MAG: RidA family protein [Solirubrobacterales bacterium]|nr:RidA family protein [Solirubrobacterales bacterium]MBV8942897.1 RidA family protein [Solirubrobacterales bacterium]MBV9164604.1 RidA family protein [Solirubrobacterales bacterium]MBV9537139.1 RidA family protein [Solirubrobacterales bacterium]
MSLQLHRTPAAGGGSYSDAVVVDIAGVRWIHVAGQTPQAAPPHPVPTDVSGQARLCFRQIESILAQWDASLTDVVQITVYLTSLEDYGSFASVRAGVFGSRPPASAAVGVASLLDDALVEIAAVAVTTREG